MLRVLDSMRKKLIAAGVATTAVLLILSPSACYLSRGAWEEGKILARRKPIVELVRNETVASETRAKLTLVLKARGFAANVLGLRAKESFTAYSPLDRDTLVLVLSAAYRDRLEPYTWWFPIVGRVPYKGYFDFKAAQKAARKLFDRGFDVALRPSDAFSTLGWFNDPLLSTTLRRDSVDLVNTVIHELTHNTFYPRGSAAFNESFASFVGARGAADFFRATGNTAAVERANAEWDDEKVLGAFWTELAAKLESAYAKHPPDSREARIASRDSVYAEARRALVSDIAPRLHTVSPFYAQRVPLDNASLLARRVYARQLDLFDAVWEMEGRDLRRSVVRIIGLAKQRPEDPYGALQVFVRNQPRQ